jgi:hypothetical protein
MVRSETTPDGPQRSIAAGFPGRALALVAGPAVIVLSVPVALYRVALEGRVWNHDPLLLWMPMWTYLGRSLRAGHIPLWQTGMLSGAPFASDPQSGWGYLEPMVLFSVLSPQTAMRVMVLLQPIVAGLGLYAFLRSEALPRWAACTGGVGLALGMTGATIGQTLPFSAGLAWTAVALASASRMMRASTPTRAVLWMLGAALAWGQLLAAHAGLGVIMGTLAIIAYLVGASIVRYRDRQRTWRWAIGPPAALIVVSPIVNLAFLLPRIAYLPETNMGLGYLGLARLGSRLTGGTEGILIPGRAAPVEWLVGLATVPGAYVGGAILLGSLLCVTKRWRQLGGSMLAGLVVAYLLSLTVISHHIPLWFDRLRPVDLYLHAPNWLGYEILLFIAVLGALGVSGWVSAARRTRVTVALCAVVLWLIVPLLLGVPLRGLALAVPGMLGAAVALEVGRRYPLALWAVPCLLACELGLNAAVVANSQPVKSALGRLPTRLEIGMPRDQMVYARVALRASRRTSTLTLPGSARYVVRGGIPPSGRNPATDSARFPDWGLLSGAHNAGGYNAVELFRYWKFVRVFGGHPLSYEQVTFRHVSALARDLLRIGWILEPSRTPGRGDRAVLRNLHAPPQATLVGDWTVARSAGAALAAIRQPAFNPGRTVVLEGGRPPGSPTPGTAGTARYHPTGAGTATITADATHPAVLLIRTPYAHGWTATVDGRPVQVRAADYVDQGIIVPAGRHVIKLVFMDPWVTRGLIASFVAIASMLGLAAVFSRKGRRERTPSAPA